MSNIQDFILLEIHFNSNVTFFDKIDFRMVIK